MLAAQPGLLAPELALAAILERVRRLEAEETPLGRACGRALAEPVLARGPLPAFDSSAVDGYAVRAQDTAGASSERPVALRLTGLAQAGRPSTRALGEGQAARILTGARVPEGADAVVMQEHVELSELGPVLKRSSRPGEHVRRRGEDARPGQLLLDAGSVIRPYEVALLAAQGLSAVRVFGRPRLAVLSTGDELVEAGVEPADGLVRDANGPALCAALERWGAAASPQRIAPDEPAALERAFSAALERADGLIVSGGASVGDRDGTAQALRACAAQLVFAGAAIKPGKPFLFAVRAGKPVFGLPGNPVAALVCLEEFVRPAVEAMQGLGGRPPSYHLRGRLSKAYVKRPGRVQYLFCAAREQDEGFVLEPIRPQGAHRLAAAARANALARVPAEADLLSAGTELAFRWLK